MPGGSTHAPWPRPRDGGFTFLEILVALSLMAAVSHFVLQGFIVGIAQVGRANERAAATTVGIQILEQIRASANPYTWVNAGPMPRQSLPLPAPYSGVANPTPHRFQIAVDFVQNDALTISTATVRVYRPADPDAGPLVSLTTVLDDQ